MTPDQAARKLADALAEMARAETKLHRALTRWSVARRNVKRLERQLDRAALAPTSDARDPNDKLELGDERRLEDGSYSA